MSGPPLEALVAAVEALDDPRARDRAQALVTGVLELHREALTALLGRLRTRPDADAAIADLAAEPTVRAMLLLHDLHPTPAIERAREALGAIEPELRGLGALVASVEPLRGGVRVRLTRADPSKHGKAIRAAIEAALLEAAPDVELLLEGAEDGPALVDASRLTSGGDHAGGAR